MTETMKKFKPPFRYDKDGNGVYDAFNTLVAWMDDESGFRLETENGDLIADALNFYYASRPDGRANQRERSERKGEKE